MLQQRLETLKKLEDDKNIYRKEDVVDGETQDTFVVENDQQDYVQFCEKTGMIVGYGDEESDFGFNDTRDDLEAVQWAIDLLNVKGDPLWAGDPINAKIVLPEPINVEDK